MKSMLQLLGHILRISSRRDRTEINSELLDAMADLFQPRGMTLYRCYANEERAIVFACAGINANGKYVRNAYLPDQRYCKPIDTDLLLKRCQQENSLVLDTMDQGFQRLVFPISQDKHLLYLIDVVLPENFLADQRVGLMGLTEFFAKHIALLDYGESDTLTGLANRKTFDKHLFEVLGSAATDASAGQDDLPQRRHNAADDTLHWLAVCDIDKFKSVNDTYGHLMGDEVLVVLAQLMRKSFRLADQLFRFGGEEFVVVLQPTSIEHAHSVFERFRANVAAYAFSQVGRCTISIRFTQLKPSDSPSAVIDRADEALYYAKEHGRNQVAFYEELISSGKMAAKTVDHGEIELF